MMNKAFTLIELTVAVFLITVGTVGAFTLTQRTIAFTAVNSSQLTAAYLAQEGIENVRNTRDSNWLSENPWTQGIASTDWQIVNMNGQPSKFQRRIIISEPAQDQLNVSIEVSWSERGNTHQMTAQTELYNWYEQ